MVLHRKNILSDIAEPLIRSVIDMYKGRNRHLRIQGFRIHHVAVVLGGNIDTARGQVLDRMIAAPVSVFQLIGICSVASAIS